MKTLLKSLKLELRENIRTLKQAEGKDNTAEYKEQL